MRTRYASAGVGQVDLSPPETVGHDPYRHVTPAGIQVTAGWAQRAANAGIRYNDSGGALIAVDGQAGPVTITVLRSLSHQFASDAPVTNSPATSRVTALVIVPAALEARLSTLPMAPSPSPSTVSHHAVPVGTTSHVSPTTGAVVATPSPMGTLPPTVSGPGTHIVPSPDAGPGATPGVADEGSTRRRPRWFWPAVVGGVAIVGAGAYMLSQPVTANRRRPRRNRRRHRRAA